MKPVVFLDRDGTLNEEVGYIRELEKLVLIDGAAQGVKKLNDAGIACVLVTNQTGAARGYYPEEHIRNLNDRLCRLLGEKGARIDAVYYCPHLPEGTVEPYARECDCRKPLTGMVEKAFSEHPELDRARMFVVGDKSTDVELARNLKATGILVATGYGQKVLEGEYQWPVEPDYVAHSIVDAVDWILKKIS